MIPAPRAVAPLFLLVPLARAQGAAGGDAGAAPDFRRAVRPLLASRCFPCHGPDEAHREAGLRLDQESAARRHRAGGAAVVPGDPDASLLLARVTAADPAERMPPPEAGAALTAEEVRLLRRWIEDGAPFARHWSFEPIVRPEPPPVPDPAWVQGPIDAFVLARLDAAGLAPAPEADRATLARRLALDLVGIPPTPEKVRALLDDGRPDALERYVERLLDDPGYGERWARVWLDLARYADSAGYGSDPLRTIWPYRDWVIRAWNDNVPFDELTVQQTAGDLLPDAGDGARLATAFHRNSMTNTEGGTDDEEFRVEAVKDRTNTTLQVWMGLTAGCAQCHSHKFDPLSHEEYYRLFAFFNQTADTDRDDEEPRMPTPTREQRAEMERLQDEIGVLAEQLAGAARDVSGAALEAWSDQARRREASWKPLVPAAATSAAGAELAVQEDGTVVARGPVPDADEYAVTVELEPGRWTGLQLLALPDPELPGGGPGRGNGNFVLTEARVSLLALPRDPVRGRYLRIELPGKERILSVAEVEVLEGGANVAPAGTARQSSTAFEGDAARAIDGDPDGHYFDGRSVTHTEVEDDPWWLLDLGRTATFERVAVHNRTDGVDLQRRLDGAVLSVLDEGLRPVWRSRLARAPDAARRLAPADLGSDLELAEATADFGQADWDAAEAIDGAEGPEGGWAVSPELGTAHRIAFAFAEPLVLERPRRLLVRLVQSHGAAHVLGRFRLHATRHEGPVRAVPRRVVEALGKGTGDPGAREVLAEHYQRVDPVFVALRAERARLEAELADLGVVSTPVLAELPEGLRRGTWVLEKGNFLQRGAPVEPGVPAALHPLPEGAAADRLGLARWLVAPENPLTARVAVNRLWARLFGTGLVETEEDFGSQGALPSHPELLDWLATEYVASGWDTKALLATIVASATYRQSSRVTPEKLARDPGNRLLSRGSRFRLEAEIVRDQALAVAGLLSRKMYGPPVHPPQPPGLWRAAFNGQREWPTSAGEDRYRRAVYVFWRRTVPYPSMEVFDAPSRETCTPRRVPTNTPLQAFVTLNDPVYVEAAQALARRMMAEGGSGAEGRARRGLWLALQRPPREAEVAELAALHADALAHFRAAPDGEALALATDPLGALPEGVDARDAAAWTAVANVLLNLDEVLTRQ